MNDRPTITKAGLGLLRTSYCDCGCRTVRLHSDAMDGTPLVTIQVDAAQAIALARDLVEDAERAQPGISKQEASACH